MKNNVTLPEIVLSAFPPLVGAASIQQLVSPDTTFNIFATQQRYDYLALVMTDYADPYDQSDELKRLSGKHRFEFLDIIKPHTNTGETIEILKHDDMEGDFFVTIPYKNYKLYYYLVRLKSHLRE